MKKVFAVLVCLCLVIGLTPVCSVATKTHNHSWSDSWTANDTHHWHACDSENCDITDDSQSSGYGEHDFSQYPYRCAVCHFGIAHEHYGGKATCMWNATCEGCGTVYGDTDPDNHQHPDGYAEKTDAASHKIICDCGYVFAESQPHNFTPWDDNSDGTQERWCEGCLYAESRKSDDDSAAPTASEFKIGGTKFQPAESTAIPAGATFTVEAHTPQPETVLGIFNENVSFVDADAEKLKTLSLDGSVFTDSNGVEYRTGETVKIDDDKYCIKDCNKEKGTLSVVGLADGAARSYDMTSKRFVGETQAKYDIDETPNRKIKVDGVVYDISLSYKNSEEGNKTIISYDGKTAGVAEDEEIYIYDDLKPEVIKERENEKFLGTVKADDRFENLGVASGKSYKVYWVGSEEIGFKSKTGEQLFVSKEEAENKLGTVKQSFGLDLTQIPSTDKSLYIALHTPSDGQDFETYDADAGTVTVSEDGSSLLATYLVYHFSPFGVYALTESKTQEIKTIVSNDAEPSAVLILLWVLTFVAITTCAVAAVLVYKRKRNK